jgi:hypothetical protein
VTQTTISTSASPEDSIKPLDSATMSTLTDQNCERLFQVWKEGKRDAATADEFKKRFFNENLKAAEDLRIYMSWWTQHTKPQPLHIPRAEMYIQIILGTNFTCNSGISHVTSLLDLPISPYIAIGTFAEVAYRLAPNSRVLVEDRAPDCGSIGEATLLPSTFLGFNFEIEQSSMVNRLSQVKEESFSEQVDALAKLDDTQTTSFPFFQLGHLEYFPRDPKHLSENDLFSDECEDAGFGVGKVTEHRWSRECIHLLQLPTTE